MTFENHRRQHAVGQGFFHSATVSEDSKTRLRYVYDCGAMAMYGVARDRSIDELIAAWGAKTEFDILYLSHVHADHINGISRLLDRRRGLKVDTIMLPLLDVADRLIGYARTAAEDPASATDAFYRAFIVDPAAALQRFEPRQILFVAPGEDDGGAPGSRPDGGPDRGPVGTKRADISGRNWVLVGNGEVRTLQMATQPARPTQTSTLLAIIPQSMAAMARLSTCQWLLAPYVDPGILLHRPAFMRELATQLKLKTRAQLDAWLARPGNMKVLVTKKTTELATAYAAVTKDLNITSLCLYSGPLPDGTPQLHTLSAQRGTYQFNHNGASTRLGWLATGDACLGRIKRLDPFLAHYGALLDEVASLTMPHHGSDRNFREELLTTVAPRMCVAAADRCRDWRHPGTKVVQTIASHGLFLLVATADPRSELQEWARIG